MAEPNNKANYVTVLPRTNIDVPGYNPVIDVTRAVSPRKATSNVIANNHPRSVIGLIISKLDELGGAENYSMEIPEHYNVDVQTRSCVVRIPKITAEDIKTAKEIEVCQFIAGERGGNPRFYLDIARKLLDKIS